MEFKNRTRTVKINWAYAALACALLIGGMFVYTYLVSENSIENYIEKNESLTGDHITKSYKTSNHAVASYE